MVSTSNGSTASRAVRLEGVSGGWRLPPSMERRSRDLIMELAVAGRVGWPLSTALSSWTSQLKAQRATVSSSL